MRNDDKIEATSPSLFFTGNLLYFSSHRSSFSCCMYMLGWTDLLTHFLVNDKFFPLSHNNFKSHGEYHVVSRPQHR